MHGAFDDVPRERILAAFAVHYPRMAVDGSVERDADFQADVARDTRG